MTGNEFLEATRWMSEQEYDDFMLGTICIPSTNGEWHILKSGEWHILNECSNEGIYCSVCHKKVFKYDFSNTMKWKNFKYCPNCGSYMRGIKKL